jgi:hypothetical protein
MTAGSAIEAISSIRAAQRGQRRTARSKARRMSAAHVQWRGLGDASVFAVARPRALHRPRRRITFGATVSDHVRAPARVRREDAVVKDQVDRRPRRERRQLLEEVHRLEEQMRGPVAPRPLQLHPHAAVAEQPQSIVGQWRAQEVAAHVRGNRSCALWRRLLGRPVCESGRLCRGDGGGGNRSSRALVLAILSVAWRLGR